MSLIKRTLRQQTHHRTYTRNIDNKTHYLPGMTFYLHFDITNANEKHRVFLIEKKLNIQH